MSVIPLFHFRYLEDDPIAFEIARIQDKPKLAVAQKPRRDSFYVIFWITSGTGRYTIDFETVEIRPFTLFFIAPGQIHYWETNEPLDGYAILFEEALFLSIGVDLFFNKLNLFNVLDNIPIHYLPTQEAEAIEQLCDQLDSRISVQEIWTYGVDCFAHVFAARARTALVAEIR